VTSVSLDVELKAKSGKKEGVASFLAGARSLVAAESGTVAWFAVRFDKSTFATFDAFNDETDRDRHLLGRVADALMARADELFAKVPQIRMSGYSRIGYRGDAERLYGGGAVSAHWDTARGVISPSQAASWERDRGGNGRRRSFGEGH
jgi:hypothetical protein